MVEAWRIVVFADAAQKGHGPSVGGIKVNREPGETYLQLKEGFCASTSGSTQVAAMTGTECHI
jgi:hypothetical protein